MLPGVQEISLGMKKGIVLDELLFDEKEHICTLIGNKGLSRVELSTVPKSPASFLFQGVSKRCRGRNKGHWGPIRCHCWHLSCRGFGVVQLQHRRATPNPLGGCLSFWLLGTPSSAARPLLTRQILIFWGQAARNSLTPLLYMIINRPTTPDLKGVSKRGPEMRGS